MSDSVKPEEKPVVLEGTNVAEEIPTTSEAGPATVTDEVTAADPDHTIDEATSEEKKEEKAEPKEITHGTLSKAHGGLLAFFKQKRFFYFQDEAISEEKLKTYLHKDTASLSTAAYASQTGKGLLLYSKAEGQREAPHGIIKLADVTEVVPSGNNKFILKLATSELHFESPAIERDSWVFTLNHKIAEAKATADEITSSEAYKTAFERLSKPVAVTVKAPEKTLDPKEQEAEDTEAKIDTAAPTSDVVEEEPAVAATDKKADVKRSPSKKTKRTSVFAFMGDRKKKPEEKKEVSADKKEEEDSKDETKPTDADVAPIAAEASTDAPTEVKETIEADETEKSAEPMVVAPKPTKRNSIFGAFSREKKEKEIEEEKKEEVKSEAPESSEPVDTEAKPIESAVETPAVEKSPASSPPKPKFLASFFDKKEKSPAVKTPEKETEVKSLEATGPTIEVPIEATETTPVVDDSTVADSASPATSPKEQKRKSSFFASFKKDKKVEDVKSDSEDTEPVQKSGTASPVPKTGLLTGLMRKASKSTKNAGKEADTKEVAAPETVAEEPALVPATTDATETAGSSAEPIVSLVGDVPEAVTVAQAPVQATV